MLRFRLCCLLVSLSAAGWLLPAPARASSWPLPTADELHMTAPAEDPGANALYLSFDEDDNDLRNVHVISVRLKVLTQAGVERYADVQVGVTGRHFAIENVEAQTVHADGRVIPFTGRPFVKTIVHRGESYKATVFSMPDVQVGSILEYRYRLSYSDNVLLPAHWFVQQNAFLLHGHFTFRPFDTSGNHYVVTDHGQTGAGLMYVSWLPKDAKIEPANTAGHPYYELTVNRVPALPDEEFTPPSNSFSNRMLFFYSAQMSADSYWAKEGKYLSKDMNTFATAGPRMKTDVPALYAATDAPELKAQKLYAAAMKLENSNYTRAHSQDEDAAQGLRAVKTAEDIWVRQRGTSNEIALTYLAMLRLAGIRAFGMEVTNRDRNIFVPNFIDTSQLDDTIVIANLGGQDVFLDPGTRYCPYGQLAWRHSWASGVRQVDGGTQIATAGALSYKDNLVRRTALLGLDESGEATGTVTLSYTGQKATLLRQREIGEDAADTRQRFEQELRQMLPGGMKLHVISIANLSDGEKPLQVVFAVNGPIGTVHGHRLLVQQSLLRGDETERFTATTRKNDVYFPYPYASTDIVELQLPPGLKLEAVPQELKGKALDQMAFTVQATSTGNKVQMTRTMAVAGVIIPVGDYPKLREFFGNLRSADENQLLFSRDAGPGPGPQGQLDPQGGKGAEAANAPGK